MNDGTRDPTASPENSGPLGPQELSETRAELDRLDAALFRLLAERRRIVHDLWRRKKAAALPVRDFERERAQELAAQTRAAEFGWPPGLGSQVNALVLAAMHDPANVQRR